VNTVCLAIPDIWHSCTEEKVANGFGHLATQPDTGIGVSTLDSADATFVAASAPYFSSLELDTLDLSTDSRNILDSVRSKHTLKFSQAVGFGSLSPKETPTQDGSQEMVEPTVEGLLGIGDSILFIGTCRKDKKALDSSNKALSFFLLHHTSILGLGKTLFSVKDKIKTSNKRIRTCFGIIIFQ
jgi:hypothetical protein